MIAPRVAAPQPHPAPRLSDLAVRTHAGPDLAGRLPALTEFVTAGPHVALSQHPGWLPVLAEGLGHTPYALEAVRGGKTVGYLGLADVRSLLFGRFLVSLPYLNSGGVLADDEAVARALVDRAVDLADHLGVRFLELRHEHPFSHPALTSGAGEKVQMRRPLPATADELWKGLKDKVRNQIRKGQKSGLSVAWGREDVLPEFYKVFSYNMRDLGTPVYGRTLFQSILRQFPDQAEVCVVRTGSEPAAAALLLHGWGVTEVPSASSVRAFNPACANVLMYWHLLERAVGRGQKVFDFGRCSPDGNTFKFKKQWGAEPSPAPWQHYLRTGTATDVRPSNPRYGRLIQLWQKLPVWVAQLIGPTIVRGIP
jgi:FemAB-related protein (PEP-CTERM system-associated)